MVGAKHNRTMFFTLIFKALTIRADRVCLALAAITLGASVVTALLCLYLDIKVKMSEELRAYGANFIISSSQETGTHNLNIHTLQNAVRVIPPKQLVGSTPIIYGIAHMELGDAVLTGVSFIGLKKVSPYWQVKGSWIGVDFDDRHAMIGQNLAKTMELKLGDSVDISGTDSTQHTSLKIRGIIESGGPEDDQIFVSLPVADHLLQTPDRVDFGLLSVAVTGQDADLLAQKISEIIPETSTKPIRNLSQSDGDILEKIDGLMAVVALFILVMTTLCVNATLTAMVAERTKEIGLQKALGATNGHIIKQFLSETAFISFCGAILGILLGYGLAQILGYAVFGGNVAFHSIVIPITASVSIGIGMLAAIAPARRSTSVSPALTLRGE